MLIFNTYNTLNQFTALISLMSGYIIMLSIITNVQKILLHTGGGCLATRQKRPNLPYLVH